MKSGYMANGSIRKIDAIVELNNGTALDVTERLKELSIERVGADSKFFGFGISHKLSIDLLNKENDLTVQAGNKINVIFKDRNEDFIAADETSNAPTVKVVDGVAVLNTKGLKATKLYYGCIEYQYNLKWDAFYTIATGNGTYTADFSPTNNKAYALTHEGYYHFVIVYTDTDGKSKEAVCEVFFATGFADYIVTEVQQDKVTNALTLTACDALNNLSSMTVGDLELPKQYTLADFASAVCNVLGLNGYAFNNFECDIMTTPYEQGANFEGTESLSGAMDALAETLLCIYFIAGNKLVFKRLKNDAVALTVTPADYFALEVGECRELGKVVVINELGDGWTHDASAEGVTQHIRDNPFLEMQPNAHDMIEVGYNDMVGASIQEFECTWRGNYLLEVGDCVKFIGKNETEHVAFILDDVIKFNGAFSQVSRWAYGGGSDDRQPATLTEVIAQTYAKVDKVNKQITLVASETDGLKTTVADLLVEKDRIALSVSGVEEATKDALKEVTDNVATITDKVNAQITQSQIDFSIETAIGGIDSIETREGFTFDKNGLTITNSESKFSTQVTEDGMKIYDNTEKVLTVDNTGVNAKNLHATTYLIVGNNSRFEDYVRDGEKRTGCFWIGG